MMLTIEELLEKQYDVLGHGVVNGITEIRTFKDGFPKQIFCHTKEEFIDKAQGTEGDLYVGINPRASDAGSAADISYLTCLVIDIDPVREKNTPSTKEQHEGALAIGKRIYEDLLEREQSGVLVSSGSGCHVYFPIEPIKVTNVEALTESTKKWMDLIRGKYATKEFKIDAIHDLPRVIRVWGSHNRKSNRLCGPLGEVGGVKRLHYSFSQETKKPINYESTNSSVLEQRFDSLLNRNVRLREIVNGVASYPSPSESDCAFISILAKAHFSVEEIKALHTKNPSGNHPHKKGDVERLVKKHLAEESDGSVSLVHGAGRYTASLDNRKMGIRTGFNQLDEMISGLKRQKLYILPAARPNGGKTTFEMQIADYIADKENKKVLIYPSEEGYEPLIDKIVSRRSGVQLKKFQNGTFLPEDRKKIDAVIPDVQKLPIIVVEDFGITPEVVEHGIKKCAPDVTFVDFFQAMQWNDPDSVGEKNDAVRKFKKMVKDYNTVIIILSQLNRGEGESLARLKGCGALEELADVVAYLEPVAKPTKAYPVEYQLKVRKSKYSATGVINMDFYKSIGQFIEVENKQEQ